MNEESSDDEYVFGSLRNKTINDEVTQNATSQDEDPSTLPTTSKEVSPKSKTKKKIIAAFDSSDEDGAETNEAPVENDDSINGKRSRLSSDSDSEKPTLKRSRKLILDSDED